MKLDDYEYEYENIEDLRDEIDKLGDINIFPRYEITLPEKMKFDFLKENWDKISLEDLEKIC